jgi:hypothetical protein
MKQDCFFWHYQQNHLWLREKSVPEAKCPKKDLVCGNMVGEMEKPLMTESNKTKMFQEPET